MKYKNNLIVEIKVYPSNVNDPSEIKFSVGWKPEIYRKIDGIFGDNKKLKEELFLKFKDVHSFKESDYKVLYEQKKEIFDESILRFPSTRKIVDQHFQKMVDNTWLKSI